MGINDIFFYKYFIYINLILILRYSKNLKFVNLLDNIPLKKLPVKQIIR